jgi:hypothetical protein
MARTVLTHAVLAVFLLLRPAASPAADGAAARTSYRTARVLAVEADAHRIGLDFGTGATALDVDPGVSLDAVASGDNVLVAIREGAPRPRITYLHRSGTDSVGVAAFPGAEPNVAAGSTSIRRPLMLVPNPKPRGAGVALAGETTSAPPVAAVAVVSQDEEPSGKSAAALRVEPEVEPAAPVPSSVDALRTQGLTELERNLAAVDVLAREADVAWNMYVAACPGAASAGSRGWLTLEPAAAGGQDTCDASRRRVAGLAEKVRTGLRSAEEHARAGWVPPGNLRDAFGQHGFEATALR